MKEEKLETRDVICGKNGEAGTWCQLHAGLLARTGMDKEMVI